MMKKVLILCLVPFFACGDGNETESPSLKEAREAYSRMMDIADETAAITRKKLQDFSLKQDSLLAAGDSLLALQLAELNVRLDSLHSAMESSKAQAEEMRAHTVLQEPGDEHEHHHHNHSVDYSEFSIEQLLELQLEMENQAKAIQKEIIHLQPEITENADSTPKKP